jgi:hypothetical protein
MSTHDPTTNDIREEILRKAIKKLGEQARDGHDSLPRLALRVIKWAEDGLVNPKPKGAKRNDKDDAQQLFEWYAEAEGKGGTFAYEPASLKAQVSKLRQVIKCGVMTTIGHPEILFERARDIHKQFHTADPKKVKQAYEALVSVARMQLEPDNSTSVLTDDQIKAAILRPGTETKELEQELSQIFKRLEGVITGENKHGLKDQSPDLLQAHECVGQRIKSLAAEQQQLQATPPQWFGTEDVADSSELGVVPDSDELEYEHHDDAA